MKKQLLMITMLYSATSVFCMNNDQGQNQQRPFANPAIMREYLINLEQKRREDREAKGRKIVEELKRKRQLNEDDKKDDPKKKRQKRD